MCLPCLRGSALGRGRDWVVEKLDFDKVSGSVSFFETVIRWVPACWPAAACGLMLRFEQCTLAPSKISDCATLVLCFLWGLGG